MKILLILAHHDDEVRISPLLLQHVLKGDSIKMLVCTRSHIQKVAETRLRESHSAFTLLGQDSSHISLFDYIDGTLIYSLHSLYRKIKSHIEQISPDIVYVPAFEGGNIDHEAINIVMSRIKDNSEIRVKEFSLYNALSVTKLIPFGFGAPFIQAHQMEYAKYDFSEEERDFFIQYFSQYKSQFPAFMFYIKLIRQQNLINNVFIRSLQEYRMDNIENELPIAYQRYSRHTFTSALPFFDSYLNNVDQDSVGSHVNIPNQPLRFYFSHALETILSKK
jgi:LmbE family N-acetylglucosaminyl deacetylase